MTDLHVTIPPVIEGYSDVRGFWYSPDNSSQLALRTGVSIEGDTGPDLFDNNRNTQEQLQTTLLEQRVNAKTQLRFLNNIAGGKLSDPSNIRESLMLSTNGESDIVQMSWTKDTESPAGVMNLVLLPRRDYANMMNPEDVIMIYGKGDKYKPETLIALISVDSVRLVRTVNGEGATVERVNVTGRDLGKILMETPTIYDQGFGGITMGKFFSVFLKAFTEGFAQGGPSVVVQTMLAIFFSMRQNFVTLAVGAEQPSQDDPPQSFGPLRSWRFPGKSWCSMFSFLDTVSFVQTPMVGALIADASLLQNGGNLWNLCDMYANRLVNEFFIDTRDLVDNFDAAHKRMGYFAEHFLAPYGSDGSDQTQKVNQLNRTMALAPELLEDAKDQPEKLNSIAVNDFNQSTTSGDGAGAVIALVHRQLPYDTFSFYMLPTSIVYETECFDVSLERGSHDILNFFRIRFPGLVEGVAQDEQFGTTINRNSIEQHGIRRFEGESIYPYVNEKTGTQGSISSYQPTFDYYMSAVTAWYAYNERLKSGTITMRFRPDIRVGTRLTFVYSRKGHVLVEDYYVQRIQHSYGAVQGQSRTTVELVRGIERTDANAVGDLPESHLFWSHQGRSLDPDPYETVVSEDVFGTGRAIEVTPNQVAPGDP